MNFSDYIVYLWLIPVSFQIVVPLAMLSGWGVGRLASRFLPEAKPQVKPSPLCAG